MDQPHGNVSTCIEGNFTLVFDDSFNQASEACCSGSSAKTNVNHLRPDGSLSEFAGASMNEEWTLALQDMQSDQFRGVLYSWSIEFVSADCVPKYLWTPVAATAGPGSALPVARYQGRGLAYDRSFFLWGGRDSNDLPLTDIYRFDTNTSTWTTLNPVNFQLAFEQSNSVGSSFLLTSWGLLRFGGYFRNARMTSSMQIYNNDVFVMDPVTMRWRLVEVQPWNGQSSVLPGTRDSIFGVTMPAIRYLAATAFVPSCALHWRMTPSLFSYRMLYDRPVSSIRSNYAGALADSVVVLGGFNGAPGSIPDGSTGGMLNDMWILRLSNWSTSGSRDAQNMYMRNSCLWRNATVAQQALQLGCLSQTAMANCELRDVLMLAWCAGTNQTMA